MLATLLSQTARKAHCAAAFIEGQGEAQGTAYLLRIHTRLHGLTGEP